MRRYALFLCVAMMAGCGGYRTVAPGELVVQKKIELRGKDKPRIFEGSKRWIAAKYPAIKSIVTYESPDCSVLISRGELINHDFGNAIITFTSQINIADDAATVSYVLENVESGAYKRRMTEAFEGELIGARADIAGLISSFENYLTKDEMEPALDREK